MVFLINELYDLDVRMVKENSTVDSDPESGAFLTPGSGIRDPGWVKKQYPDMG
jgi:hypothetical protein